MPAPDLVGIPRADLEALIQTLQRDREEHRRGVSKIEERLRAMELIIAEHGVSRPRIWESEDGRKVIWWALGAMVASCLALAGGLTYGDIQGHLVGVEVGQ